MLLLLGRKSGFRQFGTQDPPWMQAVNIIIRAHGFFTMNVRPNSYLGDFVSLIHRPFASELETLYLCVCSIVHLPIAMSRFEWCCNNAMRNDLHFLVKIVTGWEKGNIWIIKSSQVNITHTVNGWRSSNILSKVIHASRPKNLLDTDKQTAAENAASSVRWLTVLLQNLH